MKKRKVTAILAATAAVILLFAACSKNGKPDEPTNPTVVGADGKVYEEVTELQSEVVTELVTEVVTEKVTDKDGKDVTKKDGKPEIKTEVKSEVVTKVVTTVVTVTKPVVTQPTTEKGDKTTAGTTDGNTAGSNSQDTEPSSDTTAEEELVTMPQGVVVEVPTDASGKPTNLRLKAIMENSNKNKQMYLKCRIVTNEKDFVGFSDVPFTMSIKGDKMMLDVSYATMRMQVISKSNEVSFVFPAAKVYYTAQGEGGTPSEMDFLGSLNFDELEYVKTTTVKQGGANYICEEYKNENDVNKYYFNSNGQLKRIEMISSDGTVSIMKVEEYGFTVSDSMFEIPKGYSKLSEDALNGMLGGMENLI